MINAIVAIGKRGQMGLNGRLPWHDREDLLWFRRKTMGGVLICGAKTLAGLPESVHEGRRIIAWTRENLEDVIRALRETEEKAKTPQNKEHTPRNKAAKPAANRD